MAATTTRKRLRPTFVCTTEEAHSCRLLLGLRRWPEDLLGCAPPTPGSDGGDHHVDRPARRLVTEQRPCTVDGEDVGGVEAMLEQKRLVLVLDLDHTLLHTTAVHRLRPREASLLFQEPTQSTAATVAGVGGGEGRSSGDGRQVLFNLADELGAVTKLRPFVDTFLREVSTMYHLCICTMGERAYAQKMARILDPDGIYFLPGDIFSRSDFTRRGQMALEVVRRGDGRTTVILDDTVAVWEKHQGNLIPVPSYWYFAGKHGGQTGLSLAELGEDEDESTGALTVALDLLRRVHTAFFDLGSSAGTPAIRDVREILKDVEQRGQR